MWHYLRSAFVIYNCEQYFSWLFKLLTLFKLLKHHINTTLVNCRKIWSQNSLPVCNFSWTWNPSTYLSNIFTRFWLILEQTFQKNSPSSYIWLSMVFFSFWDDLKLKLNRLLLKSRPGPWTWTLKNLDPEKPGSKKKWTQENLDPENQDPEKPGPWKT